MGISKKSVRRFRFLHALITLLFGGLAAWLFITGGDFVMASLLAAAAIFTLIDAILGWRKSRD